MEGLWIARFSGQAMQGAGVVVFSEGKILGGDGGYLYEGSVTGGDTQFQASLKVTPHTPGYASVFGTSGQTLNLVLEGTLNDAGTVISANGYPRELPQMKFQATLSKRVA